MTRVQKARTVLSVAEEAVNQNRPPFPTMLEVAQGARRGIKSIRRSQTETPAERAERLAALEQTVREGMREPAEPDPALDSDAAMGYALTGHRNPDVRRRAQEILDNIPAFKRRAPRHKR